ncbi:MAG: RIP metalloprotease RseP [Patescibacteria group bacterium]|jgi:regulator of sigma E protease
MFTTIIIFLVILSILVFAHELGHFWTAKKLGLTPKEFGFGFPPRIGGFYKTKQGKWRWKWGGGKIENITGTIYSINYLPLGGFVNVGEDDDIGGDEELKNDPKHFKNQKPWKRGVILTAGVVMNLILAAVFFSIGYMIGLPKVVDEVGPGARFSEKNIQVVQILSNTPAEEAGVKVGDIIISINGQEFANYKDLSDFAASKNNEQLDYKIKRGKEELDLMIVPEPIFENDNIPGIGIAIAETGLVSYPWYLAIWEGIKTTIFLTWYIIVAFAVLIKSLIMGHGAGVEIAGPVGIANMTGQMAQLGFVYILQFSAILSINLAIINYLPFPALDGGRVLFLIIEKFRGKPVSEKVEAFMHNLGFILLMLAVAVVTLRDVLKLFN